MSLFVPKTKTERRSLLQHLDSLSNKQAISDRQQNFKYQSEVIRLREYHKKLFSDATTPPIVDDRSKLQPQSSCPWARSGLTSECERVAEAFDVPIWYVLGDANSAVQRN